jgi:hypothetical protein
MAIIRTTRLRYDRMHRHLKHVVVASQMFDSRTQRRILTKADHLWVEIRRAFKAHVAEDRRRAELDKPTSRAARR